MRLRSVTYTGTWPPGVHWTPGEVRTVPDDWPGLDPAQLPAGLVDASTWCPPPGEPVALVAPVLPAPDEDGAP